MHGNDDDHERRNQGVKPVASARTEEEREQMDEETSGHPWAMTYKEFLDKICSDYGFKLLEDFALDPQGRRVKMTYLERYGRRIQLPGHLEPSTRLDETVTASLCRRAEVPPAHFGLRPEEPWDDDELTGT